MTHHSPTGPAAENDAPIDLAAVHADDVLLDALGAGMHVIDPADRLGRELSGWHHHAGHGLPPVDHAALAFLDELTRAARGGAA